MQDEPTLAIAQLDGVEAWRWDLKLDSIGLYRWYLNGNHWTTLRGATRAHVEAALRRFVAHALNGTLVIVEADVLVSI